MKKKIETQIVKKEENSFKVTAETILGGRVGNLSGDRDYASEVAKIPEDQRVEIVEFVSPATGNRGLQTIDRRGTTDEKLGMALLDPNTTEDRKLSMLSLYLFEKGKESASFIADLMLHKGTSTRETRKFKSEMRYDFTTFTQTFCNYLYDDAQATLDVLLPEADIHQLEKEAYEFLLKAKEKGERESIVNFVKKKLGKDAHTYEIILLDKAIRGASQAAEIKIKLDEITKQREAEAGKGIMLNHFGQAHR